EHTNTQHMPRAGGQDYFQGDIDCVRLVAGDIAAEESAAQQTRRVERPAAEDVDDKKPQRNRRGAENTSDNSLTIDLRDFGCRGGNKGGARGVRLNRHKSSFPG